MRILYHHRTASKDGQAVHIEELIEALRAEGHEVRVVAPDLGDGNDGAAKREMGRDIDWVHRLKAALPKVLYELLELTYSVHAYRKLKAATAEFRPDVIYERYNLFLLSGTMLKKRQGIPLLLEVNSPLVFERSRHSGGLALPWLARWAEGTAWRTADYVLPVTQVLAGYVRDYGVREEHIAVIPNGINKAHFATAPEPDVAKARLGLRGKLVLGFTGFVRDWHGVDHVIDWMATPDAPDNVHLLIVGDGPARSALENQARALGLADAVTFTGVVHRDAVPACVARVRSCTATCRHLLCLAAQDDGIPCAWQGNRRPAHTQHSRNSRRRRERGNVRRERARQHGKCPDASMSRYRHARSPFEKCQRNHRPPATHVVRQRPSHRRANGRTYLPC